MTQIAVIGLGYIGLPLALLLARAGVKVLGFDKNPSIVKDINSGKKHLAELDLAQLLDQVLATGNFTASTELRHCDCYVIAVPTPIDGQNKPNMSFVQAAVASVCLHLQSGDLLILESTSPVGTIDGIAVQIQTARDDLTVVDSEGKGDIHLAYCPERVLPGNTIYELTHNSRIIGGISEECCDKSIALYRHFVESDCLRTTPRMAEMVKLTENSYRDVSLAFANELSTMCHQLGVEVRDLIAFANKHPRVNILQPGTGVGGHCISVDPWFLISDAQVDAQLLTTARKVNNNKPLWVARQVMLYCRQQQVTKVLFLGLSFKPNIDDYRESPALQVVQQLQTQFKICVVIEPFLQQLPDALDNCQLHSIDRERHDCQVAVILVAHDAFRKLIPQLQNSDIKILDFCGLTYESTHTKS